MDSGVVTRLSELLGTRVRTESGRGLGRVRDVRAEQRPRSVAITGLVVGRMGAVERLGLGAPESRGHTLRRDVVQWSEVIRVDRSAVVVREEA
jgi:sporulation protein YlmC with PRC-barrel domain